MKNKIIYKNNQKILEIDNKKYLLKKKNSQENHIIDYLQSKNFTNCIYPSKDIKNYDLFLCQTKELPNQEQAIELIKIMTILHTKTISSQPLDKKKIDKIYEETKNNIIHLKNYYLDMQDYIETKEFPSPADQLLINNISKFYKSLDYAEKKLSYWFEQTQKESIERTVQLHNDLRLENLIKNQDYALINWDNSKRDYIIYDFITFYRNHFDDLEMISLFQEYQSKCKYNETEKLLFQSLISVPPKITFNKSNYINTLNTRKALNYVEITNTFLLENYKKNEQSNEDKFTE